MKPRRLNEFSIYLDQRPGQLAGVLEMAEAQGVTVSAMSVSEYNGRGLVRLLGEPVEALRGLCEGLTESGVGPVVECEVLAVETYQRPAALRELAKAMADARINLKYAYLAPERDGRPELCVLRVDDPDEALRMLTSIDWPPPASESESG